MPLIKIDTLENGVRLALWQMTESEAQLSQMVPLSLEQVQSHNRRREILTSYCMLEALTGSKSHNISHEPSDKPIVEGYEVSLSHTRGWAAMILSEEKRVGVDIEYISPRVNRVVERFIRKDEQSEGLAHRLINWSAKETVYKLLSEEDLQYFEMRLLQFAQKDDGIVTVEDLKENKSITVHYLINQDYVLTWAIH